METHHTQALRVLRRDARFARLIRTHGAPELSRGKDVFRALCRSIIYQQVSGKAAASILKRFVALFKTRGFPTPQDVRKKTLKEMRTAGLSAQKASYIKDLAEKFADGTIKPRALRTMKNEEIVEYLTRVRGVGIWTVHMLLIFTLNRPDVLPTSDLGIRRGFQIVYRLKELPDHDTMERLARPWREYASVASWYLWRASDDAKKITARPQRSALKR